MRRKYPAILFILLLLFIVEWRSYAAPRLGDSADVKAESDQVLYEKLSKQIEADKIRYEEGFKAEQDRISKNYLNEKKQNELAILKQDRTLLINKRNYQFLLIFSTIFILAMLAWLFHKTNIQNSLINSKNAELEKSNRTKDRFFTILGHELRKPALAFRNISKKVNYLLLKDQQDMVYKLGEQIERDAIQLVKLIDNLLYWSKSQSGHVEIEKTSFQLDDIIYLALNQLQYHISEKDIVVLVEPAENGTVYADKNAVLTIFRNVIDNAIKFSEVDSSIFVNVKAQDHKVITTIIDEGKGISDEEQQNSFDQDHIKKMTVGLNNEEGVGIGLYLVNELAKINNGEIYIESKRKEGTRVQIILPASANRDYTL